MSEQLRAVPWYDRNPKAISQKYWDTGVSPHTTTTRWTYTVPKDRLCYVEHLFCSVTRNTVADAVQACYSEIYGKGQPILIAKIIKNEVGDREALNSATSMIILGGDSLGAITRDFSTGGKVDYCLTAHGLEFDAFPIEALPFEIELPRKDIQEPSEKPWWWPF